MASTQEIIKMLLQEHECEYEEAVVSQLNEFAIKYMRTLIQSSEEVATQQDRNAVTIDDLKMAMSIQSNNQVNEHQMEQIARKKNSQRFLELEFDQSNKNKNTGIKLPAKDTNSLSKPNYQLVVIQQQQPNRPHQANNNKQYIDPEPKKPTLPQRIKIEIPETEHDF